MLFFQGPSASGKGTQAALLCKELNYSHIDMGGTLRKICKRNALTAAEQQANEDQKHGRLVADTTILAIYRNLFDTAVRAGSTRVILDGCARTKHQADSILMHLKTHFPEAALMGICFQQDEAVTRERMETRFKQEGRIDDKDADAINNRIASYYTASAGLPTYFERTHRIPFLMVQAARSIEDIARYITTNVSVHLKLRVGQMQASA